MTRAAALDASTRWGGVALVEEAGAGPVVVAESGLLVRDSHAAHLLGLLDALLRETGWGRGTVDLYVATRGPGSFTGLRVGLGTVRGLALAAGRICLGVGTLEAMAESLGPVGGDRVPLLDAGRGEVFGARYDGSSTPPDERAAPWLGPAERALEDAGEGAVLFGPGADAHGERLRNAGWRGEPVPTPRTVAAAAARLALHRHRDGAAPDEGMTPLYLRPPDAELPKGRS